MVTPAFLVSAPMALKPSSRAATSAGPEGRVSRAYTTLAGFDTSILAILIRSWSAEISSSVDDAFASTVACDSQDDSNISPRGSTSLTPLSCVVRECVALGVQETEHVTYVLWVVGGSDHHTDGLAIEPLTPQGR